MFQSLQPLSSLLDTLDTKVGIWIVIDFFQYSEMLDFTARCFKAGRESDKLIKTSKCEFVDEEESIQGFTTNVLRNEEDGIIEESRGHAATSPTIVTSAVSKVQVVACFITQTQSITMSLVTLGRKDMN